MELKELFKDHWLMELSTLTPVDVGSEVESGEEVIGQMNDFEKACSAFCEQTIKMLNQKISGTMKVMADFVEARSSKDEEFEKFKKASSDVKMEYIQISRRSELVNKLMWDSIKSRFDLNGKSIGIRKGFKVVSFDSRICEKIHIISDGRSSSFPDSLGEVLSTLHGFRL